MTKKKSNTSLNKIIKFISLVGSIQFDGNVHFFGIIVFWQSYYRTYELIFSLRMSQSDIALVSSILTFIFLMLYWKLNVEKFLLYFDTTWKKWEKGKCKDNNTCTWNIITASKFLKWIQVLFLEYEYTNSVINLTQADEFWKETSSRLHHWRYFFSISTF